MALIKGDNQHNILKGGENNDALFGFDGIDFLYGNGGNDWLNGGPGIDKLSGGIGNDTYVVDTPYDSIIERPNAGTDTVKSSIEWSLAANEENLVLTGASALDGYGNSANNTMTGNVAANTLYGNDGNDILDGGAGVDALYGGNGDDVIKIRNVNGDKIDGGSGNDVLEVYGSNQHIDLSVTGGLITDIGTIKFSGAGHNVLTLSPQSLLDLRTKDSNTLTVDGDAGDTVYLNISGWIDGGIQGAYHLFTQQDAMVKINTAIANIVVDQTPSYTISNAASAEQVGSFFTSDAEEIVIDFGGRNYGGSGPSDGMIDLSGFGLEDTLMFALHDGVVNNPAPAHYHEGNAGSRSISQGFSNGGTFYQDRILWKTAVSTAKLVSYSVTLFRTCFKSVASGSIARRTERRNRNVLDVHEDFEYRATPQSSRVAAFKTRS